MAFHYYTSRMDGMPTRPGDWDIWRPVEFPYTIINPYGTSGYTHCGKHTGTDFTYVATPNSNMSVYPAMLGWYQPGPWSWWVYIKTVVDKGDSSGHGNYVILWHTWPGMGYLIETEYSHIIVHDYVTAGAWMSFSDPIGTICMDNSAGECGSWTGPHLHFEVRYRLADALLSSTTFDPASGADLPYVSVVYDDARDPASDEPTSSCDYMAGCIFENCNVYVDPQNPAYNERGKATHMVCRFPDDYLV